jgi:hypothetical protein
MGYRSFVYLATALFKMTPLLVDAACKTLSLSAIFSFSKQPAKWLEQELSTYQFVTYMTRSQTFIWLLGYCI